MSVTFYSTKRSSNVDIPRDRVCGYRIKNDWTKTGYSDGVRAGRDNGVVNQRLSRFATEQEREEAGSNCSGNTNWLNHKVRFNKPESADNQFWIKRPAFKEGTVDYTQKEADELPENIRFGTGNREIVRNNFLAPPIKARFTGDFDALQALDIAEIGKPEAITDNKLGYFTQIKIPDPNDFTWLREKRRLEGIYTRRFTNAGFDPDEIPAMVARELEINKPLGRDQRTINKSSDSISSENRLNTAQKLREIVQEVQQGRVDNRAAQVAVTQQLIDIFKDTQTISNLTQTQSKDLGIALARLGIPTDYKKLGLTARFVDAKFYQDNEGMINLLLMSKVRDFTGDRTKYNYDIVVKNYSTYPSDGLPAMKLSSVVPQLNRANDRQYLDLDRGGKINLAQLRFYASNDDRGGFDGPNFNIQPSNR